MNKKRLLTLMGGMKKYLISGIVTDGVDPVENAIVTLNNYSTTTGVDGTYILSVKAGTSGILSATMDGGWESNYINIILLTENLVDQNLELTLYLLLDRFTTDENAPLISPRTCEPLGSLLVRDSSETKATIDDEYIVFNGGAAAFGNPGIVDATTRTRSTGLALFGSKLITPIARCQIGFDDKTTTGNLETGVYFGTANTITNFDDVFITMYVDKYISFEKYDIIVSLRSAGHFLLTKYSPSTFYKLQCISSVGTKTDLRPAFYGYNSLTSLGELALRQLPTPWNTDDGIITSNTAEITEATIFSAQYDSIIEFTWTPQTDDILELHLRKTDDNNCWIIRCNQATSTIILIKKQGGTEDAGTSTAQTWTTETAYKIVVSMDVNTIRTFVDNVTKSVREDAWFNNSATGAYVSLPGTNLNIYPRYLSFPSGTEKIYPNPDNFTATNAAAPLTIPAYTEDVKVVHPGIYYNENGWNGYKYWMVFTPHPLAVENPSIVVSNDGTTWIVPPGLTNPIEPAPASGFYSDPDIYVDSSGKMWMVFRYTNSGTDYLYVRGSTDGITWSEKVQILTGGGDTLISPCIFYDGESWVLLAKFDGNKWVRYTSDDPENTFVYKNNISWVAPDTRTLWHVGICIDSDVLYAFISTRIEDGGVLYLASSLDWGNTWRVAQSPLLSPNDGEWDGKQIYRSTAIKTSTGFDLFYSAQDASDVFRIGRTTVTELT